MIREGGHRPPGWPMRATVLRRFTLVDAMVLIAATGIALVSSRSRGSF